MCGQRGFFRRARVCGYRPLPCEARKMEEAMVQSVKSQPVHSGTLAFPRLLRPNQWDGHSMGETSHSTALSGYNDPTPPGACEHTHTLPQLYTHMCTHTQMHTLTYILLHTHISIHTHTHHLHIHTCSDRCIFTKTHTYSYAHTLKQSHNTHTFNLLHEMQPVSPPHSFAPPSLHPIF